MITDNEFMRLPRLLRLAIIPASLLTSAVLLGGVGVFLAREGLDRADRWSSVFGFFLNFVGISLAAAALRVAVLQSKSDSGSKLRPMRVLGKSSRPGSAVNLKDEDAPMATAIGGEAAISNLPNRNPLFTNRAVLLANIEGHLTVRDGSAFRWHVLHGMSGVGKTQIAIEYAHLHKESYGIRWWIPADGSVAISSSMGALIRALGLSEPINIEDLGPFLNSHLPTDSNILLIFDDAGSVEEIQRWIPSGIECDVIITSQSPSWGSVALVHEVDTFQVSDACEYLRRRLYKSSVAEFSDDLLQLLVSELGCLPLAVEQAAAYAEQVGITLNEYRSRFREFGQHLLNEGHPAVYGKTIIAASRMTLAKVRAESPEALDLLRLCACFDNDGISIDLIKDASLVTGRLKRAAYNEHGIDRLVEVLLRYSLVRREPTGLATHRIIQACVLNEFDIRTRRRYMSAAVEALTAAWPPEPWRPEAWQRCGELIPHAMRLLAEAESDSRLEENPTTAILMTGVGLYFYGRRDLNRARTILLRALAIIERTVGDNDARLAVALENAAVMLRELGELDQARMQLERALEINRSVFGPASSAVAACLDILGITLREAGEFRAAEAALRQALSIKLNTNGTKPLDIVNSLDNLGITLRSIGRLNEAQEVLERALELARAGGESAIIVTARVQDSLGGVYGKLGNWDAALRCHDDALSVMRRSFGNDHAEVAITLGNQANALRSLGENARARIALEEALTIKKKVYGQSHPEISITLGFMAEERLASGSLESAAELLRQARVIAEAAYGVNHVEAVNYSWRLSRILKTLGQDAEAGALASNVVHAVRVAYGDLLGLKEVTEATVGPILESLSDTVRARALVDQPQLSAVADSQKRDLGRS